MTAPPKAPKRPAGRPRKVSRGAIRYTLAVDPIVREEADARAEAAARDAGRPAGGVPGTALADVMRKLMESYAAGRIEVRL